MPKKTRLGPRSSTKHTPPQQSEIKHDPTVVTSVSYRGPAFPQDTGLRLNVFDNNGIIMDNQDSIYKEFIEGRSQSSLTSVSKGLRFVDQFTTWLTVRHNTNITSNNDLTPERVASIYEFLEDQRSQSTKMKFFRRFLRALGFQDDQIPPNPYKEHPTTAKSTNSLSKSKSLITHFKSEAQIVIQRFDECQRLIGAYGQPVNPRRIPRTFWDTPENRMYALIHWVGLRLRNLESMRSEGLTGIKAGFNNHPGAMTLRGDGIHARKTGLTGHLRWFYPCQRDLLPFVNLIQMRTNFPIAVVTGFTTKGIVFRDSHLNLYGHADRLVQLSALKFRTVSNSDGEPQYVRATLLKKPWSYPFKLIEFLKKLREPLAEQLALNLQDLKSSKNSNPVEIARLTRIQHDLFLYHADGEIGSLGEYADAGEVPSRFPRWMKDLGFESDFSRPRNSGMLNGFFLAGGNKRILTLLGDHSSDDTSKYYLKRKEIKETTQSFFNEYFGVSIALIDAGAFTKDHMRALFYDRGFNLEAIENLLSDATTTHWGNNCATPTSPPSGFGRRTLPGCVCTEQNCIDGCPSAVWFPQAVDIVQRKLVELERRRARLTFISSSAGFLNDHITRCRTIITELLRAKV